MTGPETGPALSPESAAELRAHLGPARWIRRLPSSPRSQVWLAEFGRSPVIVKRITGGADAQERYDREVTALRLAVRTRPAVVPALLATVGPARVLVLERLSDRRPHEWVRPWAVALARLHATPVPPGVTQGPRRDRSSGPAGADDGSGGTGGGPAGSAPGPTGPQERAVDPEGEVADLAPLPAWTGSPDAVNLPAWTRSAARVRPPPVGPAAGSLPAWVGPTPADVEAFLRLARRLRVPVPPRAPRELAALLRRLDPARAPAGVIGRSGEGPGRAAGRDLLHGDPCPGNDLYSGGTARFVDLEQAEVGPGLVELAYLRIGFPTCWCVTAVPARELAAAEAAYRQTYRQATGSEPAGDLTDACAGWLIRSDALVERSRRGSAEHPVDHFAALVRRDWTWGTVSARERLVYRLDVVAGLAADRDDLAGLARLSTRMRDRMRHRWPGLAAPPAVRPD